MWNIALSIFLGLCVSFLLMWAFAKKLLIDPAKKLEDSERELRLFEKLMTNSRDTIIITEAGDLSDPAQPRITYTNPSFRELTGFTSEEIIGQTPRVLQGEESCEQTRSEIRAALRDQTEYKRRDPQLHKIRRTLLG